MLRKLNDLYVTFRGRYNETRNVDGRPVIYIPHLNGEPKQLNNKVLIGHLNQKYTVGVYAWDCM